jgi:hypothetical protein
MRRFALIGVAIYLLAAAGFYFHLIGRFDFLHRTTDWQVAVNGVTVDGEVLVGRTFVVATRGDKGKEHSYLLFYAGDVDQRGDMGIVIDCREWIAPRLPILIETHTYPNCKAPSRNSENTHRMSLLAKGGSPQFLTQDGEVISIRKR